jgi:DNA replication protein DnaC
MTQNNNFGEQSSCEQLNFDTALNVIDDLVFTKIGRHLSEPEITLMKGAWDDDDYEEIAKDSPYTVNYLQRHVAPQLWNLISATVGTGEKVSKKKLRNFLESLFARKYHTQTEGLSNEKSSSVQFIKINGEPPDISNFCGRIQELNQIKELITQYKCLSLIGIAGIGKTALAAKLLKQISTSSDSEFECLIWKSVAHAPVVQDLVTELIQLIQPTASPSLQVEYTQAQITTLLKEIQSRRCLIVLDEIDTIFQTSNFEQRLEYRLFFRRLIEEQHQSCFLLTSRIFPNEFGSLLKAKRPLKYLKIKGLDTDAAMQFLLNQGLTGKQRCQELINTYYGHPAELQGVIERIHHFFAGSTEAFFDNKTTFISPELQSVLDELFSQSLSQIQREIMLYLAGNISINSNSINFAQLLKDFTHVHNKNVSVSEIVEALESLENHSLIESIKDPNSKEIRFSLQPVIKKYISNDPLGIIKKFDKLEKISVAS